MEQPWNNAFCTPQGLKPHPDKIAETSSLSSVPLPKLPYKMSLPGHVLLGALPSAYVCWPPGLVLYHHRNPNLHPDPNCFPIYQPLCTSTREPCRLRLGCGFFSSVSCSCALA